MSVPVFSLLIDIARETGLALAAAALTLAVVLLGGLALSEMEIVSRRFARRRRDRARSRKVPVSL